MQTFSPTALEYRPEHNRSAGWFATLAMMMNKPKLDLTCHLQNDGSQVFVFAEEHGRNFEYRMQVWPNGNCQGGRIVKNSE